MPVLLAVAYALGWLLAHALRLGWWLLRAAWWVAWRVVVVALALLLLAFSRSLAWRLAVLALGAALSGRVVRKGGRGDGGHRRTLDNAPGGGEPSRSASSR